MSPGGRGRAYAFYATHDAYALAVLVFVARLRRLGIADGTDVVLLHLPLSETVLARARAMRIATRPVPPLPRVQDPASACRDCLTKLRVLGLAEYDRVVYADADAVPLRSLDELFEHPFTEPLAAPAAYWLPQPWWATHLLVVKPSAELWSRAERHLASAAAGLHDMDIVNLEFRRDIHTLPGVTACLNTEWEDAGRAGAFGDPEDSFAQAAVAHFTALGKPWSHTPADVRRLRPNAHPIFHRLWSAWWETRDEALGGGAPRFAPRDLDPALRRGRARGPSGPGAVAPGPPRPASEAALQSVAPATVARARDFHLWFAREFRPLLGIRYRTMFLALLLGLSRGARTIVETGTTRHPGNWKFDGQSTVVFGAFAQRYGGTVWTCDVAASHVAIARELAAPFAPHVEYAVSDSVEFLRRFPGPIDLLYLDALDFDAVAPATAQEHALREGEAALHLLHEDSLVLIDDCGLPEGGKGARVIPFLIDRGWRVVRKGYQVLLARKMAADA